jgi:hypothetical protein
VVALGCGSENSFRYVFSFAGPVSIRASWPRARDADAQFGVDNDSIPLLRAITYQPTYRGLSFGLPSTTTALAESRRMLTTNAAAWSSATLQEPSER